jgi:small subunit ribosomal protein S20
MANHKSSKKRIVRNDRAAKVNRNRLSALRTAVKKVEVAIASGDATAAKAALKAARPQLQRNAAKKIVTKKAASRKVSRLSVRIKALDTKA